MATGDGSRNTAETRWDSQQSEEKDLRARISFQRDIGTVTFFVCLKHGSRPRSRTLLQCRLTTFLFYGWTEQPRPVNPKVEECVS